MLRHFAIIILVFCFHSSKASQRSTHFSKPDSITANYIEKYDTLIGLYIYGIRKYNSFQFIDAKKNKEIQYKPNDNLNFGFGFNYKWLGLGVALNLGLINNDDHIFGNTQSLDLQLDMFPKGWLINSYIQWYKGYYWSNPTAFFSDWNTADSLQIRQDIRTFTLGASGVYAFNYGRFSYKAPFVNTEFQTKSAGSLLAGGSFSTYRIRGDESLIPENIHDQYPATKILGGVNSTNLGVLTGYSYTLVFYENFYANLSLLVGLNYQNVTTRNLNYEKISINNTISSNGTARFAIGYNQPKYYLGFTGILSNYNVRNVEEVNFAYDQGKFRFFLGFRFNTARWNKKLDKVVDFMDQKNPLSKKQKP